VGFKYDTKEAERLLDEAGFKRGADSVRFTLRWMNWIPGQTNIVNLAIKDMWEKIGVKTDYQFDFRNYAFGNLAYDNDRFAGIAERYAATVGYGRHVLRNKRHKLDIEIGVGANRTRDQDEIYETAAIGTLGGKYTWTISPNAEFTQTLRTEGGVTNVYVNPITALKLTIVGNLFATFNHEIRYNTEVPSETRHLDQITTINLGYSFGTPPA
jgi:putative salt-induced outer membrane protein